MANTESTKVPRTHMVSYAWKGPTGNGYGAVDMTLPNGFDGPETRNAVERFILDINPTFTGAVILNVIRYGSL